MLLRDAIEKAENDEGIKKIKSQGYFLGSIFATAQESINEWILHFYSSKKNKIIDCYVGEDVSIGEEEDAINKMTEVCLDKLKIMPEHALAKAKKRFNGSTINIMLILHNKEIKGKRILVWTINFIAPTMVAKSYDVDAYSGKVVEEKETSLITRYSRAS